MVFQDFGHLETVVEGLYSELQNHQDLFYNEYGHLTIEEIDVIADNLNFNDYQPRLNFEQELNFISRRELIEAKMEVWLNNQELDFENCPDYLDSFSPEFRSVLSPDGKIIVNGDELNLIKRIPWLDPDCYRFGVQFYDENYSNNNKKYDIKVEADSWPWLAKIHTRVRNYKRKSNGGWKADRVLMSAQVIGQARSNECGLWHSFGDVSGNLKRKRIHVRDRVWDPDFWVKYKKDEVCGSININNNQIFTYTCIKD